MHIDKICTARNLAIRRQDLLSDLEKLKSPCISSLQMEFWWHSSKDADTAGGGWNSYKMRAAIVPGSPAHAPVLDALRDKLEEELRSVQSDLTLLGVVF